MNQKIKSILQQSGLQPYYDAQEGHIEKFAELLIKECANIVQNTDLEDVEGGDSAVLSAASQQIETTFFKF